jgi:hypothetical protein
MVLNKKIYLTQTWLKEFLEIIKELVFKKNYFKLIKINWENHNQKIIH